MRTRNHSFKDLSRIVFLATATQACLVLSGSADYQLTKSVIANGGGAHASDDGRFNLRGSAGQPEASSKASSDDGRFAASGGYWKSFVVQVEGAPTLNIRPVQGELELSWDDPRGLWMLESSTDLRSGTWMDVPDGTLSPVMVTPNLTRNYFRLRRR